MVKTSNLGAILKKLQADQHVISPARRTVNDLSLIAIFECDSVFHAIEKGPP